MSVRAFGAGPPEYFKAGPSEVRRPAAPTSIRQAARRVRILRAASALGARDGLAGVQMHDVAREAGVAIATLYRYFPSKPGLFLAVLEWHIEQFLDDTDTDADLADTFVELTDELLASPLLASAVALSSFTEYAGAVPTRIDITGTALGRRALGHLGSGSRVRMLVYTWWGLFVAVLTEELTPDQAEHDLRLAARLAAAR
ncbi:TetR/AcrR family transcriptional regulator [Streptomyces sp. NPDC004539]|uniref:TetR/AcrR family transcriptional regulator n=1 Tax=Streptomyces sp. NPDC004539 TaxID=3154280 RepID=UPI0033AE96B1